MSLWVSGADVAVAGDVGANKQRPLYHHQLTCAPPRTTRSVQTQQIIIIIITMMTSTRGSPIRRGRAGLIRELLAVTHLTDVASRSQGATSRGLTGSSTSTYERPQDQSSTTSDSVDSASSMNLLYRWDTSGFTTVHVLSVGGPQQLGVTDSRRHDNVDNEASRLAAQSSSGMHASADFTKRTIGKLRELFWRDSYKKHSYR